VSSSTSTDPTEADAMQAKDGSDPALRRKGRAAGWSSLVGNGHGARDPG
jgi:hypothetical protein